MKEVERAAYVSLRYVDVSLEDTHRLESIRIRADVEHESVDNELLGSLLPTDFCVPRPHLERSFKDR